MSNQPIKIPDVEYAMLLELSKKDKKKPHQYLIQLINQQYNGKK